MSLWHEAADYINFGDKRPVYMYKLYLSCNEKQNKSTIEAIKVNTIWHFITDTGMIIAYSSHICTNSMFSSGQSGFMGSQIYGANTTNQ